MVKETARRFKDNTEIISTATDYDRDLSVKKSEYVSIDGDKSIFKNRWTAAGGKITWNMVHYDVQLIGGAVLHSGKIAEMATGEGKTLVSTLPAYLNALAGEGVHIVTVNDYLARRDQEWNGPIFEWLGLKVDCIDKHQPNRDVRRRAPTEETLTWQILPMVPTMNLGLITCEITWCTLPMKWYSVNTTTQWWMRWIAY